MILPLGLATQLSTLVGLCWYLTSISDSNTLTEERLSRYGSKESLQDYTLLDTISTDYCTNRVVILFDMTPKLKLKQRSKHGDSVDQQDPASPNREIVSFPCDTSPMLRVIRFKYT